MIVTAGLLRRTVEQRLRDGLPDVLAGLAAAEGLELPPIVTWNRMDDFRRVPERQAPACVVTTPGIVGEVDGGGCRTHVTSWQVRVFFVARGRTYEETADRVAAYTAAGRSVLLTGSGRLLLPGDVTLASSANWTGETYAEAPAEDVLGSTRTVGAGSVTVTYAGVQTGTTP